MKAWSKLKAGDPIFLADVVIFEQKKNGGIQRTTCVAAGFSFQNKGRKIDGERAATVTRKGKTYLVTKGSYEQGYNNLMGL